MKNNNIYIINNVKNTINMSTNNNGLIYYKLDSLIHGYEGDITKNCGLRGEEIDGNFHFLRGEDIQKIYFDDDNSLFIVKNNGIVLHATQSEKEYQFSYDKESNTLIIINPNNEKISFELNGFKVEIPPTKVFHDYTMKGNGQELIPLGLSNISKTGQYKPAIKLLNSKEELPKDNIALHDRYVTKEQISKFGMLYPLKGIQLMNKFLQINNSEWRIPRKEDWDEMLNFIDCENPNHNNQQSNVELGSVAGTLLKSTNYWHPFNDKVLSEDAYGFSILPVGYCGNQGTETYYGFGQTTAFWTNTSEDDRYDMFVKEFNFNTETVKQYTWGGNEFLSVRLVKDFTGDNYNETEDINGCTTNCIHIPGTKLVWTKENISFTQEEFEGFMPTQWEYMRTTDSMYKTRYFVNDWNGTNWVKHELKEGECIVLFEGDNGRMHEWIVVNGELIDTALLIKEEIKKDIIALQEQIDNEKVDRFNEDEKIIEKIKSVEDYLINKIETENSLFKNEIENIHNTHFNDVKTLEGKIETESSQRVKSDEEIKKAIDYISDDFNQEKLTIKNIEKELSQEKVDRINEDAKIIEKIQSVDNYLTKKIDTEKADRILGDNELKEKINSVNRDVFEHINDFENKYSEFDKRLQDGLDECKQTDKELEDKIRVNKVTSADNSIKVTVDGNTKIQINLPEDGHIKIDDNGIYFDGNFGTF